MHARLRGSRATFTGAASGAHRPRHAPARERHPRADAPGHAVLAVRRGGERAVLDLRRCGRPAEGRRGTRLGQPVAAAIGHVLPDLAHPAGTRRIRPADGIAVQRGAALPRRLGAPEHEADPQGAAQCRHAGQRAARADVSATADRGWDLVVVGGGFYGCAIALHAARRWRLRRVLLAEREDGLLQRASWRN
ncbi:MAG: FAD-dependent oxidoreductase, partial [Xanthomonadaceae bacterium]|nr:FAD-dependent oxidoreductase [Xanthomonadaceae bacterium]